MFIASARGGMITGIVTADREAILRLTIYDANGMPHERDAVADTGFTGWLTLPPTFIGALRLRWQRQGRAMLADGSEIVTDVYEAVVLWNGQRVLIPVSEADADPLIGMSLMYGYELLLPILDGAAFQLRLIANP